MNLIQNLSSRPRRHAWPEKEKVMLKGGVRVGSTPVQFALWRGGPFRDDVRFFQDDVRFCICAQVWVLLQRRPRRALALRSRPFPEANPHQACRLSAAAQPSPRPPSHQPRSQVPECPLDAHPDAAAAVFHRLPRPLCARQNRDSPQRIQGPRLPWPCDSGVLPYARRTHTVQA